MLDMDLQLFADEESGESIDSDQVVEESGVDEQIDVEEVNESVNEDEQVEEQSKLNNEDEQVKEHPKQNDTVSLSRFMQEKKRRKDLERVLSQQEAERKELNVVQQYLERGYPEFEATNLAKRDVTHDRELESLKSRFQDSEIKDLSRSGDFFSDAETFTDEIKEKMKSLNISAKDAYMLVRGETRSYEVQLKKEQRAAVQRKQTTSKTVTTAKTTTPTSPYKLDENDKKALAGLQKAQPDGGWSVEKYYKLMKT